MAAPLFKKNTLEQTGFAVTHFGFTYRGVEHSSEDVVETASIRIRHEHKVLLVGSSFTHSISVRFLMRTGEQLQVTEQPTWFSNSKLERVEQIQGMFDTLSAKTFVN